MSDLISRQAAIDGLSKLRPRMIDTYEKDGDTFLKVRAYDVNDMLEGLPSAQPEQHWIPCSEPPKKDGVYIVYAPNYSGGSSSAKECHDGVMFSKYKKGKWSIEHGYYKRPNCAKAWMPLPEPWKGEDNAN